jgi:lipopolysaccharide export system protein LptA
MFIDKTAFNQIFRPTSMRLLIFALSLIFIFYSPCVWSQEGLDASVPIQIEADRMETSQEEGAVLFSGNVQARQGNLNINADEMTVLYTKAGPTPDASAETAADLSQKIDKITAKGNVKIVQEDWVAAGDTMEFNADDRIVVLAGNAKAWQDQNMVTGEKIVLYLDKGKSVVERSTREGERVKAFIYPSSQEAKDSNTP